MRWPPRLEKLEFHGELQQRVETVAWPRSLKHLSLLGDFDQPVGAVLWPPGLTVIRFGNRFRQSLAAVRWPPHLEKVELGSEYDKSLVECSWPAGLRQLTVPAARLLMRGGEAVLGRGDEGGGMMGEDWAVHVDAELPEDCIIGVLLPTRRTSFSREDSMMPGVWGVSDTEDSDVGEDVDEDLQPATAAVEVSGVGSSWDDEDELLEMGQSEEGFGGDVDVFGFEEELWDVGGDGVGDGGDRADLVELDVDLDGALGVDLGVDLLDGGVDVR